jgi:tetratricopeptide (TPR) repeat protein
MVHRRLWALFLTSLILQTVLPEFAPAARKYYPPGYMPPAEQKPAAETSVPVQIPPVVIIKTVPVVKPVQKDPLLVLLDEHRYFEALRVVDVRLKKSPSNVALQLLRGDILRDGGNYDRATAQFQSIYDHNRIKSNRAKALNGLGWTYYRKALQEEPSADSENFKHLGQLSENAFRQATQMSPNLSEAWAGLGRTLLLEKKIKESEAPIRRAMRLSPNGLQPQLAYAELLLAKNKPEEVLQILYGLKKTITHEPDVFLLLARASLATNRVDDAIINLKQLLGVAPEHTVALKLLSSSYERKMMPQDAEQILQKAIAINPSDEKAVETLLKIYEQRGEQERMISLLSTLLQERPEQAGYAASLISCLQAQQRWKRSYQESILLAPALLNNPKVPVTDKQSFAHRFALAVNSQNKTLLDNHTILQEPAVQALQSYLMQRLKEEVQNGRLALFERRDILLINPLTVLEGVPLTLDEVKEDAPLALEVAYLSGDQALYPPLLKIVNGMPSQRLTVAKDLAQLGDTVGALTLIDTVVADPNTDNEEARQLKQTWLALQTQKQQQVISLGMLPKKIPAGYFEKTATEALKIGTGDWKTHAALAKAFEKRREYELAYTQQRMAAHFAPTEKDRTNWERQAEKTQRHLKS